MHRTACGQLQWPSDRLCYRHPLLDRLRMINLSPPNDCDAYDIAEHIPEACSGQCRDTEAHAQRGIDTIARNDHNGIICNAEADKWRS